MPQPCEAELPQGCALIRRMAYADTQLSPATKATHLHNLSANLPAHGRLYQRTRQESTVIPQELQTLNTARPQLNPCHHEHTTRETTRNILSSTQADTFYPVTCCIAELSHRERACCCSYPLCSSSSVVSPTFHTASSFSLHRPFLLYCCNPSIAPASGKFSTNAHCIPPPPPPSIHLTILHSTPPPPALRPLELARVHWLANPLLAL